MNTMIIICTKCDREFQIETTGVLVQEYFQKNKEIYRVWSADLMKCPKCERTVVSRFADKPIAEHWNQEQMEYILRQAATRTFGKDLFAWMEFVSEKK